MMKVWVHGERLRGPEKSWEGLDGGGAGDNEGESYNESPN